jgi:hypothetical protein
MQAFQTAQANVAVTSKTRRRIWSAGAPMPARRIAVNKFDSYAPLLKWPALSTRLFDVNALGHTGRPLDCYCEQFIDPVHPQAVRVSHSQAR